MRKAGRTICKKDVVRIIEFDCVSILLSCIAPSLLFSEAVSYSLIFESFCASLCWIGGDLDLFCWISSVIVIVSVSMIVTMIVPVIVSVIVPIATARRLGIFVLMTVLVPMPVYMLVCVIRIHTTPDDHCCLLVYV